MSKSKFLKQIIVSHKDIREQRAANLAKRAEMEQESYVRDLEKRKFDLQDKIDELSDLGPKSTMTLSNPDVSAQKWVKEMNQTRLELELLNRELEIAEEIQKEWFSE